MVDQATFELVGARRALSSASLAELDKIVRAARTEGHAIDAAGEYRIARELGRRDMSVARRDLPPIPSELRGYALSPASGGRAYEVELNAGSSREALHRARRRFLGELKMVADFVSKGLTVEEAWRKVRRRLRLDPPARKTPRRLRPQVQALASRKKAAEASPATSAQPPASAPALAHPKWTPDGNSPAKPPAEEPNIPSVLADGIDGAHLKWIP